MTSKERIPTNLRTLLILEAIGHADHALSPMEINANLGLPKQTVHRLIATLTAEGFLIRETRNNRYRPSRRLRLLGAGLLHASRDTIARHQILESVANEIGEAINYVIPEEAGMRYLDRVETNWPFRVELPRGSHVPFHATASGKAFMSSLRPKARKNFVESLSLDALTPHTHRSPESLLEDLARIAKQGYAIDNEEFIEGMVAVAVPIRDAQGRFVAALATHGPLPRLNIDESDRIANTLITYGDKLAEVLFHDDIAQSDMTHHDLDQSDLD